MSFKIKIKEDNLFDFLGPITEESCLEHMSKQLEQIQELEAYLWCKENNINVEIKNRPIRKPDEDYAKY